MKIMIFIMVTLISNTLSAKQKYYKWTDEKGNIHYTSEKPEHSQTVEVKVKTNQPLAPVNVEATEKIEKDGVKEKSHIEKHYEQKKIKKKLAQKNKSRCQKARQTVARYQEKVRMSRIDKKTGETIYLEDAQRKKIISNAQKEVRKYC